MLASQDVVSQITQPRRGFIQRGDLRRHELSHSGEQPFSCPQCRRGFSLPGSLKAHQLVHMGERPGRTRARGGTVPLPLPAREGS
nr:PREDICTED: zinc finger protein 32-like [Lepisosteus oculatus]